MKCLLVGIKMFKTDLEKKIEKYKIHFKEWKKSHFCDDSIDEMTFQNKEKKIIFKEDLREHYVDFYFFENEQSSLKVVCYNLYCKYTILDVSQLKIDLQTIQQERSVDAEILMYISFLLHNNIIK